MKINRLILWAWLCIAATTYEESSFLANASTVTNVTTLTNIVTSTNIITLTNTVTLANAVTQILPATQTSGTTIAVAIISALIALIVGGIALQQFLLAKEKFRLDLFEKRLEIYRVVEAFIYKAAISREVTNQDFQEFNRGTQTISFIFGDDVTDFVSETRIKIRDARFLKDEFEKMPQGDARKTKFNEYESVQLELMSATTILTLKFEPYLKFHNWKYGLIWPKKKKWRGLQFEKLKKDRV